jgi:hypothetical protein
MNMKVSRQLEAVRRDPLLIHNAFDDTSCIPRKPLAVTSITPVRHRDVRFIAVLNGSTGDGGSRHDH